MLRLMRGHRANGETTPLARLVALLVIVGLLAVAAPTVFVLLGSVLRLL